ncbi:unnamed protein product, partial [Prorocentrum cordatum]
VIVEEAANSLITSTSAAIFSWANRILCPDCRPVVNCDCLECPTVTCGDVIKREASDSSLLGPALWCLLLVCFGFLLGRLPPAGAFAAQRAPRAPRASAAEEIEVAPIAEQARLQLEAARLPRGTQGGAPPLIGGAAAPAPVHRFRALPLPARLAGARVAGAARLGFAVPVGFFLRSVAGVAVFKPGPPPAAAAAHAGGGRAALAAALGGPAAAVALAGALAPPAAAAAPAPAAATAPAGALVPTPPPAPPPLAPPAAEWPLGPPLAAQRPPSPSRLGAVGAVVFDLRVQPVGVDKQGIRHCEFRAAVSTFTVAPFTDWCA